MKFQKFHGTKNEGKGKAKSPQPPLPAKGIQKPPQDAQSTLRWEGEGGKP